MVDDQPEKPSPDEQVGLFQRYPKLGVILVAVVAYGILLAMCVVVAILIYRG